MNSVIFDELLLNEQIDNSLDLRFTFSQKFSSYLQTTWASPIKRREIGNFEKSGFSWAPQVDILISWQMSLKQDVFFHKF